MIVPTIQQSGATSSAVTTTGQPVAHADPWLPTTTDATGGASSTHPPGDVSGSAAPTGSPRIVIESADGHSLVLTYEDVVLGLLLVTLALETAGWFR
ncbi:hypothetical protein [Halorarius litoreus]|uniref:hypothetical protein n=1 Tax=Halorarius litoreus TaxID=2962676 RepID=UPI0020CD7111|nr:hypothetical protein [Halorarius litoreus]